MKKNSHDNAQAASHNGKLDILLEHVDEGYVMQWFSQHAQKVLYTLAAGFILLIALLVWNARGASKAERDYIEAPREFQSFSANDNNGALDQLNTILSRRPDLRAKYDALIAQQLINRSEIASALPFANSALERVGKDHLPNYVDYAGISLLVAEEKYTEALEKATALKQQMLNESAKTRLEGKEYSFGSALFAYNLLRIAMLQQQSGQFNEELTAWKEWQSFMKADPSVQQFAIDSRALITIENGINEGNIALKDYIDSRIQQLLQKIN
jgi:hypothetical protein